MVSKKKFLSRTFIAPLVLFVASFLILAYHVGYSSLHPWDEAWYATIARNVQRGHILDLEYNGAPFWDHPPLGMYLMAISYSLLGISEYTSRLPSAFLGALTVTLIFITGKKLGNFWIGLQASLIVFSIRWFLFRSRTGNLDILLVFFQLLVFYLAYKAKNTKDLHYLWLAFSLSLLTKTTISLSLLPLVIIPTYTIIKNSKKPLLQVFVNLALFLAPLLPWYGYNFITYGTDFLYRNVFEIGVRKATLGGLNWYSFGRWKLLIQSMVHKWYQPFLISFIAGLPFVTKRSVQWVYAYLFLIALPFVLSGSFEIWHLIPLSAPVALLIPIVVSELSSSIQSRLFFRKLHFVNVIPPIITIAFAAIAAISWRSFRHELYLSHPETSVPARLALETGKNEGALILDSFDDFSPTMAFYSDKPIIFLKFVKPESEAFYFQKPFSLITNKDMHTIPGINLSGCIESFSLNEHRIFYCDK